MSPFKPHTIENAPEAAKGSLAAVEKSWKSIPNLHRIMAESPTTLKAYESLLGFVTKSSFSPAEQQCLYLAVSVANECEYCVAGHSMLAKKAGLDPQEIEALREHQPIANRHLEELRRFAEAVVRERGHVAEETVVTFLRAGFTKAQVLEVVLVVAAKTLSNYVNHIAQTPLDESMAQARWVAPRNRRQAA